ncbi:GDP-fucose protein O-fucosyltransferase [Quillaja saponaria]|uniref:O-fucosyltransferase family protein n=1 Tax=Quillaja saponaria TaxID=32244 RepID=A0AAD7QD87_QUISA|nr:GDP-fucose protein O-fucosyltransferase [Quillaja saponaria]
MTKAKENKYLDSLACRAMFGTLQLQTEIEEVDDSMVCRLKKMSQELNRRFVAVDLRTDMLQKQGCQKRGVNGVKSCYTAQDAGEFLKKIGFGRDTVIYVTQPRWHSNLVALRHIFPKTYTKQDGIIQADKKAKFLSSGSSEYEKVMDLSIGAQSDIFVPAIFSLIYANVAGMRIASGKTQILVPDLINTSSSASDYISPYVS